MSSPGDPRPSKGERDAILRADLETLGEGERPASLWIAIVVALALALAIVIGALTVHNLSSQGGSLPAGIFIAAVLVMLARGMAQARYWAVLGFEALLAFQILVTSLALVVASTILAAVVCLVSVLLAGWLFWKLIRVMGRIQSGEER
jgi:hypothetical protein